MMLSLPNAEKVTNPGMAAAEKLVSIPPLM